MARETKGNWNWKGNRSKLGHAWSREFTAYWLSYMTGPPPPPPPLLLLSKSAFFVRCSISRPLTDLLSGARSSRWKKTQRPGWVVSRWSTPVIARNHGNACLFGGSFGHRDEGERRVKGYGFSRPLNAKKGCRGSAGSQGRTHWLRETRPPFSSVSCVCFFFLRLTRNDDEGMMNLCHVRGLLTLFHAQIMAYFSWIMEEVFSAIIWFFLKNIWMFRSLDDGMNFSCIRGISG